MEMGKPDLRPLLTLNVQSSKGFALAKALLEIMSAQELATILS
jgi:hypothetical protein